MNIQSKHIKIDGLDVRYYKAGQGEPLLVVHGGGGDAATWLNNISELAENYTVYSDINNYKDGDFMFTLHVTSGSNDSISLVLYVYAFEYNGSVIFYRVTDDCMWEGVFQFDEKEFNTYKDKIIPKITQMYLTGLTTSDAITDYMSF